MSTLNFAQKAAKIINNRKITRVPYPLITKIKKQVLILKEKYHPDGRKMEQLILVEKVQSPVPYSPAPRNYSPVPGRFATGGFSNSPVTCGYSRIDFENNCRRRGIIQSNLTMSSSSDIQPDLKELQRDKKDRIIERLDMKYPQLQKQILHHRRLKKFQENLESRNDMMRIQRAKIREFPDIIKENFLRKVYIYNTNTSTYLTADYTKIDEPVHTKFGNRSLVLTCKRKEEGDELFLCRKDVKGIGMMVGNPGLFQKWVFKKVGKGDEFVIAMKDDNDLKDEGLLFISSFSPGQPAMLTRSSMFDSHQQWRLTVKGRRRPYSQ